jgi:hypothetical protein
MFMLLDFVVHMASYISIRGGQNNHPTAFLECAVHAVGGATIVTEQRANQHKAVHRRDLYRHMLVLDCDSGEGKLFIMKLYGLVRVQALQLLSVLALCAPQAAWCSWESKSEEKLRELEMLVAEQMTAPGYQKMLVSAFAQQMKFDLFLATGESSKCDFV